jgi:hypothetical protein
MAPTANRTLRTLQPSALAVALLMALGTAHAQVRVEDTSDTIRGRAPTVVFRPVENQTVPGQSPAVGHALRVEADVNDPDGDTVGPVTYRWRRDGAEIATGPSYVPVLADAGRTLVVEATATTDAATTDPATAIATLDVPVAANSAPSVSNVEISGTFEAGQTLTGTYDFVDADNDQEDAAGMEYLWQVSHPTTGLPVTVGTDRTYVLRGEDQGVNRRVWFSVMKATALTGVPNETVRPTVPEGQWQKRRDGDIHGRSPVATNLSIDGALLVGQVLTASYDFNDPDGDAESASAITWYRASDASGSQASIVGEQVGTGASYTVQAADQGYHLMYVLTPRTSNTLVPSSGAEVSVATAATVPGSAPSVSNVDFTGTLEVGQTLTGSYTFVDGENDPEDAAGMEYAWYVSNPDTGDLVQVGTQRTYVVRREDQGMGQTVVFSVEKAKATTGTPSEQARPTTPAGQWQRSRTGLTITGRAPVATNLAIDGVVQVGQVLTGSYDFSDPDGDAEEGTTLTWHRATDASGSPASLQAQVGIGATYTVQAADQGRHVVFSVRPYTNSSIQPSAGEQVYFATPTAVPGSAPSVSNVDISGTFAVGQTLTGTYAFDDDDGDLEDPAGMEYLWQVSDPATGLPVTAGTDLTYVVRAQDQGATRKVWFSVMKAKSLTGTPSEQSRPTDPAGQWQKRRDGEITGRAPTMTAPTITGTVAVGQVLTGSAAGYADADGDAAGTHTYKWYRAGDAAGTLDKTLIAGATSATYTVVAADSGKFLVSVVTPVSATGTPGTGEPVSRVTSIAVPGTAPSVSNVDISGTFAVGQTLTGTYTFVDPENDAGMRREWNTCGRSAIRIPGCRCRRVRTAPMSCAPKTRARPARSGSP